MMMAMQYSDDHAKILRIDCQMTVQNFARTLMSTKIGGLESAM